MPIFADSESASGVTLDDIATSLGRPISDSTEQAQVVQWIGDAELIIRARLGDLSELDQGALAYVVREAVVLKVKRPDPAQRVEISVDDSRMARSYEHDTGQVTITPEWWALLSPTIESAGIYSVRPGFEADTPVNELWS